MKLGKKLLVLLMSVTLIIALTACSGGSSDSEPADDSAEEKECVALVWTASPPYAFLGDDDEFTGFDPEIVKEIDRRLDGYSFTLKTLPWDAMFEAIESGSAQLMCSQVSITPDRQEKYNFSIPYYETTTVICVKGDNTDIQSMADLEGKTVWAPIGESHTAFLEEYNKEHNDAINLHYVETEGSVWEDGLVAVQSGTVDALINEPGMLNQTIKENGFDCKLVGEGFSGESIGILFAKTDEGAELRDKVDAILQEMKDDGTLSNLCVEWIGADYIPE